MPTSEMHRQGVAQKLSLHPANARRMVCLAMGVVAVLL